MRRRTIAREVVLEGAGLHEGLPTRVRLRPAAAGAGVRFRRADLEGSEPIPCHVSSREERPRRTAIVRGPAEVHTVEHLMAAVSGLGVTDLEVEIDRVELPGMDGSARDFAAALVDAGLRDLDGEAPVLRLDRVVEVSDGTGARIVALPCPGRLVIEYQLDYGGDCPAQRVAIDVTAESFARDLAPARTFCLEREAVMLRAAGLGKGATTRNTLVIGKDGLPLENALRFPDEYARHKALDVLGDLALLGARLEARVLCYKAGHALNAALVRELAKLLPKDGTTERTEDTEGDSRAPSVSSASSVVRYSPGAEAFEGHFPGDPVLPGVATLAAMRDGAEVSAVEAVKFRRVVRPGEAVEIERAAAADGTVRAKATVGGEVAAQAIFRPRGGAG